MAVYYKRTNRGFAWYKDELLEKAKDVGYRLLPAFNTTTGIPYPRVIDSKVTKYVVLKG